MKIKVCGLNDVAQIEQMAALKIDFMGFIFYPPSPRFASEAVMNFLATHSIPIPKVGVFVNEKIEVVKQIVERCRLDYVQLHGDESPEFCNDCKRFTKVIKAFRIAEGTNIEEVTNLYQSSADLFLFDTETKAYGGSGIKFDWQILHNANIHTPYLLSGGISADDVVAIKAFSQKAENYFLGIDINSRFEISAGVKDMMLTFSFVNEVRDI